jgi:glutamyl-Q tRNA(Asp) synthetase
MMRGRFAPSPTGPLHLGSLVAALGSYLDARSAGGEWLVRMEDLDPPREQAGAADDILRTLEALGFQWDGPVVYQSRRGSLYEEALAELSAQDHIYFCTCSRKEIADLGLPGIDGPRYPGTCRYAHHDPHDAAIRLRTDDRLIEFQDAVRGTRQQRVESEIGDFVLRRRDGLYSYQLAVVVDDADQGITDVVRGADLMDSTGRQIFLQRFLNIATPAYLHLPLVVDPSGQKLSKQSGAQAVDIRRANHVLCDALQYLGQETSPELRGASAGEILEFATSRWDRRQIPVEPQTVRQGTTDHEAQDRDT